MKRSFIGALSTLFVLGMVLPVFSAPKSKGKAPSAEETLSRFVTTRYYTDEAVPDADIEKMLLAGINAESASNKQPWHFTAVTSKAVLQEIFDAVNARRVRLNMKPLAEPQPGKAVETNIANIPLLIIVSADKGADLNAGLATQSIAIMAQILGYGTKVETSPAGAINENLELFAEKLGIPEGKQAVALIKIGKADPKITSSVDGYTSPTTRNPFAETTTRVK